MNGKQFQLLVWMLMPLLGLILILPIGGVFGLAVSGALLVLVILIVLLVHLYGRLRHHG